jgi:hypothetical protein
MDIRMVSFPLPPIITLFVDWHGARMVECTYAGLHGPPACGLSLGSAGRVRSGRYSQSSRNLRGVSLLSWG